jgi:hypothetical protein
MFWHVVVHHPHPEHRDALLASMHRVREAADGAPGLIMMDAAAVAGSEDLLATAVWQDRASFEAAGPRIFAAVADDPFDEWEAAEPEVYRAESA